MTTSTMVEMGFTDERFPAGTHMCLIYSNEEERRKVIGQFLERGIQANERVAYFVDTMEPEAVKEWLNGMGVDLPEDDRFSVSEAEHTYCSHGVFTPEGMLETLREFHENAMNEQYTNVRVSGEMSWALRGIPGSERLMEYEALLNEFFVTHPVTAICQYDVNRFNGAMILDVLKVHPMMIVHGQIVQNPYYMGPKEFLREREGRM